MPRKSSRTKARSPFGEKLHQLRQERKWSMHELSQHVKITNSYISLLENGDRQPSREVVLQLSEAFFPEGNARLQDELLVLAGYLPLQHSPEQSLSDPVHYLEAQLREQPEHFHHLLSLIQLLIRQGHQAEAKAYIRQGLQSLKGVVQMQTLLAQQELVNGHYERALVAQQAAIDSYELASSEEQASLSLADLYFNLGVISFQKGQPHLQAHMQHKLHPDQQALAENERQIALADFAKARQAFETALALRPDHAYLLDECARLYFNLADLSQDPAEADALWLKSIHCFRQVLHHRDHQKMGDYFLRESSAFLAYAHTKSGRYAEAEQILDLLLACAYSFWFFHFVKACHYSLRFAHDQNPDWLQAALEALAVTQRSLPNHLKLGELIQDEPDLQVLRQHRAEAWQAILD